MQQHGTGSLIQTLLGLPIFKSEWVLGLLLALSLASIAVILERWAFYRRRRIDVDGTCVYYEVHGQGTPVLLLHGSMHESGPYIVELAKRHTVIAVAATRHASAGAGSRAASPDRLAAHAFAVLRRETREPVIVLAVGDGATTAHRLIATHPEAVRFVVAG